MNYTAFAIGLGIGYFTVFFSKTIKFLTIDIFKE